MYDNREVLCLILARGGSKGVPRKNIRLLVGKPLIKHSIDVAEQTKYIDQTYVSTDDEEIKNISITAGAQVVDRPVELASDTAIYIDAVKHLLKSIKAKSDSIVVGLETTSPIRTSVDVERCIELFNNQLDCVATVTKAKNHPAYLFKLRDQLLVPFDSSIKQNNRQQMEEMYAYTGSILVTTVNFLQNQKTAVFGGKMKGYILDEKQSMDIDTLLDFEICEFIMKKYG